jgi:hypothetical protein
MNHCLFTNYWNRIRNKTYLAYHIEVNGHESTLGMWFNDSVISFDQHYTHSNDPAHIDAQILVERWIRNVVEPWNEDRVSQIKLKESGVPMWAQNALVVRPANDQIYVEANIF